MNLKDKLTPGVMSISTGIVAGLAKGYQVLSNFYNSPATQEIKQMGLTGEEMEIIGKAALKGGIAGLVLGGATYSVLKILTSKTKEEKFNEGLEEWDNDYETLRENYDVNKFSEFEEGVNNLRERLNHLNKYTEEIDQRGGLYERRENLDNFFKGKWTSDSASEPTFESSKRVYDNKNI